MLERKPSQILANNSLCGSNLTSIRAHPRFYDHIYFDQVLCELVYIYMLEYKQGQI